MTENESYPPIEPTTFDLIIVGIGMPESVITAAASAAGKSVLHLDPNSFYGSHFSSLSLYNLTSFLTSQSTTTTSSSHPHHPSFTAIYSEDYISVHLKTSPMYSDLEISSHSSQPLEHSRKFNLDLAGPRVLFCANSAIDLMLKSGTNQYIEFKSVNASFVCDSDGRLSTVPDSCAAIFKDRTLGLTEKNQLMRFFKLVQEHLASDGDESNVNAKISEAGLQSPFVEFLKKMRLLPKIKSYSSHRFSLSIRLSYMQ